MESRSRPSMNEMVRELQEQEKQVDTEVVTDKYGRKKVMTITWEDEWDDQKSDEDSFSSSRKKGDFIPPPAIRNTSISSTSPKAARRGSLEW
ncbi:unnamed protein product [Amoebophrya sp. A25]|nr:unnamed protein product [Amoebophrya sp. A25]|eukprot:GSA25T00010171001.1